MLNNKYLKLKSNLFTLYKDLYCIADDEKEDAMKIALLGLASRIDNMIDVIDPRVKSEMVFLLGSGIVMDAIETGDDL